MFLKYLFPQYDDRVGPTLGSRVMKALGTTFLGSPESKGLGHLREDLRKSYYYIKEDRHLPQGEADLEQWQMQSILANQYREVEAPVAGKKTFYVGLAVATVCAALAVPAQKANKWASATSSSATSVKSDALAPTTYEGCVSLQQRISEGLAVEDIPDFKSVRKRCQELAQQQSQQPQGGDQ